MLLKFVPIEPDRRMTVRIKNLNLSALEVTDAGIELEFQETNGTPNGKHTGDLMITPTRLIWNRGKTSKNGSSVNWREFFKLMTKHQSSFPTVTKGQKTA